MITISGEPSVSRCRDSVEVTGPDALRWICTSFLGGFRSGHGYARVEIIGDLGGPKTIRSVRALTQSWLASGIYHSIEMNVEFSSDRSNWIPFGSTNAFPATP